MGVFVAMDIIGILPMYLSFTRGIDSKKRKEIVNQSIFVAALVAIVFVIIGDSVFSLLGISLADFKIGGGLVLMVISIIDLVKGKHPEDKHVSTGVVPLAVPLITGPGVITTVMLQVGIYGHIAVIVTLLLNFLFAWVVLNRSHLITRVIGEEGAEIVSKIAALFMTAIAVSMIRSGFLDITAMVTKIAS